MSSVGTLVEIQYHENRKPFPENKRYTCVYNHYINQPPYRILPLLNFSQRLKRLINFSRRSKKIGQDDFLVVLALVRALKRS